MAKRSHTIREDDPYYPHLEQWLKVALAPIYEEEGLPAYVLALLASDGDEIDPKESCREKMLDFLGENTNDFVNELFRVIKGVLQ